jgi:hypothetical protein
MFQVLQLEAELQTIERVVRRIEQANSGSTQQSSTGAIIVTSASKCCYALDFTALPVIIKSLQYLRYVNDLQFKALYPIISY